RAGYGDVTRHNANLRLAGCQQARAVWPDEPHTLLIEEGAHLDHVESGDAFGDTHDERDARICPLLDCVGSVTTRHVDNGGVGPGCLNSAMNVVKHRDLVNPLAALAGGYACNDVRPVRHHLLRMELPLAARNALHDEPRLFID